MKHLIAALVCLPGLAAAHDYAVGDLVIAHPVAFETPATAQSGAGYLVITNNGETADRLIQVEADFPRVMMHETKTENDVATMVHLDSIDIPAGETVEFVPGGKHVMFMGLGGDPFEIGEEINVKLVFENAGEVDVVFNVEARDHSEKSEDHSNH